MTEDFSYKRTLEEQYQEEQQELNHFNWGAWCFGWFWGIFNKCFKITFFPWVGVVIVSFFLPRLIGFILTTAISIYFGIKGNRWAYTNKDWGDIDVFRNAQRAWAIAALITTILSVIIFVLFVNFFIALFSSYKDSIQPDVQTQTQTEQTFVNPATETSASKSNFSDSYIKTLNQQLILSIVNSPAMQQLETGEEIASQFVKESQKNADMADNSFRYKLYNKTTVATTRYSSSTEQSDILYLQRFMKKGDCDITLKNCSVVFYEKIDGKYVPTARTYYDNTGNISHKKIEQKQTASTDTATQTTTKPKTSKNNTTGGEIEDKIKVMPANQNMSALLPMIKLASGIYISVIVHDETAKNTTNSSDLASYMVKLLRKEDASKQYDLYAKDTVSMSSYDYSANSVVLKNLLQFEKSSNCSLTAQNCSLTIYYVDNNVAYKLLRSYYDDKGKINHIPVSE